MTKHRRKRTRRNHSPAGYMVNYWGPARYEAFWRVGHESLGEFKTRQLAVAANWRHYRRPR